MIRTGPLVLTFLALGVAGHSATALELEDCRISAGPAYSSMKARCGTLARPENPDDPDSPMLNIRVVVVPALNLKPEADPVVPLAGGPGQGAVQFYAAYSHAFDLVRRNRDILLVDQRGTGESAHMGCPIDEEIIEGQYSIEKTIEFTQECLDALPHDPRYFTTSVAVKDLEAVREALAYPTLNLYGVSYGSRVAQHYARRYPDVTRTIVLDGVVPPQLALGPSIAIEAQKALDNIFSRCEQDAACAERFPDLADSFSALKTKLSEKSVKLRVAHPVTGAYESFKFGDQELAAAIRLLAYHPNTVAMIPLLISEAAGGNYRPLIAQFQTTVTTVSESIALGMHNAVMCSEDAPFFDASRIDKRALDSSYLGPLQVEALIAICSIWPAGPIDDDFKRPLTTNIPTLLLSGTADPITPPVYAGMAAMNLRKAWLLEQTHQGHGQLSVGCIPRLFEQFVVNAEFETVDNRCHKESFVMPFFLDFSGPAP